MGTRSTITFTARYEDGDVSLVKIYQQYDGYIKGVGYELAEWLNKKKIVNGITYGEDNTNCANGLGCLAAQFIKEFKKDIGGLYITEMSDTEDYNYNVIVDEYKTGNLDDFTIISITNWDNEEPIFVGKPSELLEFKESDIEDYGSGLNYNRKSGINY